MKIEVHPAADLFPLMSGDELNGLVEDIRTNGQREPVTFWNGKLVDGRNRVNACERLGIEPDACELDPDTDPVKWVVSHNLHRRHLSPSQKALVARKLKKLLEPEAKERKRQGGKAGGKKAGRGRKNRDAEKFPQAYRRDSRDQAAAMLGISGKLVDAAEKVETKGVPELAQAVAAGKVSVTRAAKIAEAPKEQQAKLIDAPRQQPQKQRDVFAELRRLFDAMNERERIQAQGMWMGWMEDAA